MEFLTRFLVGFVLLANGALACLELVRFGGSGPDWALAGWVAVAAAYDSLFVILVVWGVTSIGSLYYLVLAGCFYYLARPLPWLLYLAGKVILYSLVFSQPTLTLLVLAVAHAFVAVLVVLPIWFVNPTFENMSRAIQAGRNWTLEVMLWLRLGGGYLPGQLMLGALQAENNTAVRRLLWHGAWGNVDDWVAWARSRETAWLIVKAVLGRGQSDRVARHAASFGVTELRYCLDKGVDPRSVPQLMHSAIKEQTLQQPDAVLPEECQAITSKLQLLLDHGADVESPCYYLFPPLMTVVRLGVDMTPVVRFLIGRGADVNTRSRNPLYPHNREPVPAGLTPLMLAVVEDRPEYVRILLEHGADPALRDQDGKTAWDYAAEQPGAEQVKALLARAAGK